MYFDNSKKLERHRAADVTLANLDETNDEEHDLQVKQYQLEENCLGLFNTKNPRDDNLPLLFLHSVECWHQSPHSCQDLPDISAHDDDGIFIDYNVYNPTLHTLLNELVYGDTSVPGCYMDWTMMNKMIKATGFAARIGEHS